MNLSSILKEIKMERIEKLLQKKRVLQERLYKEKLKENEMLSRRGWEHGMRYAKIGFSTRKSDSLTERIRALEAQIKVLQK